MGRPRTSPSCAYCGGPGTRHRLGCVRPDASKDAVAWIARALADIEAGAMAEGADLRAAMRGSRSALAKILGIHRSALTRAEKGKRALKPTTLEGWVKTWNAGGRRGQ